MQHHQRMQKFITIKFFLIIIAFFGCIKPSNEPSTPCVLVTLAPYAYFVERIAGKTVDTQILVPPGTNAHLFEPTPKQVQGVRKCQLWIRIGDPFEIKILKVLKETNPSLSFVELWKTVPLLKFEDDDEELVSCDHHHEEGADLHFWLSARLAQKQAEAIAAALVKLYPQNATLYTENLTDLLEDLKELDQEISTLLAPFSGEAILTSHPAFGYFCKDYNLLQLSIECEGKDPLPQQVDHIVKEAQRLKVRSVLLQAQYSNKGAQLIADKLHLPTTVVDPYSINYIETMQLLAQTIARGKL